MDQHELLLSFGYIAVLIMAAKLFGDLATRIGTPPIVGQIATGIILGPALLNVVHETPLVTGFAEVGVILLLFLAGLETDFKSLMDNFKSSFAVAVIGVVLPFLGGWAVGSVFGFEPYQSIYIGTLLVATSVSISVQTLKELGRLRTAEGVTVLGAAVIDDVLGLIVLTIVLGVSGAAGAEAAAAAGGIGELAWKIPAFFVAVVLVGKFLVPPLLNYVKRLKVDAFPPVHAGAAAIALGTAYLTESVFGIEPIIGAYLMGLMIGLTSDGHAIYEKLEDIASTLFVPVFFGSIGLVATFSGFGPYVVLFLVLFAVAVAGKWLAGLIGGRITGLSKVSSRIVGASMVSRGEVGLIVAAIGLQSGIIAGGLYTVMVLISITTSLATPILLKLVTPKTPQEQEIPALQNTPAR